LISDYRVALKPRSCPNFSMLAVLSLLPLRWQGLNRHPIPLDWYGVGQQYTFARNKGGTRNASHPVNAILNYACPYEGEPRDEVERQERQVCDIPTHAVASYSRDFKKADNPLKKITLGLLREAVSTNPESVSRILNALFNLPKVRQDEFSQLLEKTELGNIIAASNLVANRILP
jgi:hypothetical protein